MWQASFSAWCAAGAGVAACLCALWLGTAHLSASLLHHAKPRTRLWAPLMLTGLLGAVLGAAGHRLKTQAHLCDEQGIAWSDCRVTWIERKGAAP